MREALQRHLTQKLSLMDLSLIMAQYKKDFYGNVTTQSELNCYLLHLPFGDFRPHDVER